MSFLHSQKVSAIKHEYNPLLFEKILRKYDTKSPMIFPSKRIVDQNITICKKSNENNENDKILIDLNRKIKINRVIPKDETGNKENIQDNGATYTFNSASSENRQHSDILMSFQNRNKDAEHGSSLDVNQFLAEQSLVNFNKKQIDGQSRYQSLKLLLTNEADIPISILTNKQLSKCQLTQEQMPVQIDSIISVIQKDDVQKVPLKIEKNGTQNIHHIKTKLSLRILKRKLQKHSIQEVIDDVIRHRRIQLDGYCSEPQKQAITEALMSFMKNQIIN